MVVTVLAVGAEEQEVLLIVALFADDLEIVDHRGVSRDLGCPIFTSAHARAVPQGAVENPRQHGDLCWNMAMGSPGKEVSPIGVCFLGRG